VTRRFNLLPASYVERLAERRRAGLTAAALLLLLAVLGLDTFGQSRQLSAAHERRSAEQARNTELQARRAKLQPFRQLADGITGRERLLVAGMQTQVSWATVLGGLAQAVPTDASLTSFTAKVALPAFGTIPAVKPGGAGAVIGTTTLTGYSVKRFTPGVDRTLQQLASVTGVSEPRLQVGTADNVGTLSVTTFDGTTFLDTEALTGRYARGLPADDDVEVPVGPRAPTAPIAAG
jgi:hypothetical protein